MPGGDTYDRDALLAMTPDVYLRDGLRDELGQPRARLKGLWATAVCTQLKEAQASPQEVAATFEAFKFALPKHRGSPTERFEATRREAFELVGAMYKTTNNQGLTDWIEACGAFVTDEADLDAFLVHFQAVVRQYDVIVKLTPR
jgi:hypothetical protein